MFQLFLIFYIILESLSLRTYLHHQKSEKNTTKIISDLSSLKNLAENWNVRQFQTVTSSY